MVKGISARIITGIKYKPLLCRKLRQFDIAHLKNALTSCGSFLLKTNGDNFAVSWWVSAKRTRSYPYARVYDTLSFNGKKITIIPVFKDEGAGGDRDFLQWDTISLMSLLGVCVIIAYYVDAKPNPRFSDKITDQRFDYNYLKKKINNLRHYHSDALHWNMLQVDEIAELSKKAVKAYAKISKKTGVKTHSQKGVERRINQIIKGRVSFMSYSRELAKRAQNSESQVKHLKEKLSGTKGKITIKNYLGGNYYFTADEMKIMGSKIYLIEGKNTQNNRLPALEDIKDGLLKMIIFCNLQNVSINGKRLVPNAGLKLTADQRFKLSLLPKSQIEILKLLREEARVNGFQIIIDGE